MTVLTDSDARAIEARIVADFGDGAVRENMYLFDQITRLPAGCTDQRITARKALAGIPEESIVLLFDRHPNNRPCTRHLAQILGAPDAPGFVLSRSEAESALNECDQCDLYLTTLDGRLLLVACHEDTLSDGERVVWAPVYGLPL
jgi:hypothetical protein